MKATDSFKKVIQTYLEQRAGTDELFAVKFKNESKNIDDCATYILNTVQKSGLNGFADDEIFGMAVHYYDEESIEIGKPINSKVVVNHTVEITEEDKEKAKEDALKKLQDEAYAALKSKPKKVTEKPVEKVVQASLFD